MAFTAAKAATAGATAMSSLRGVSSGQEANPEIHETVAWPQERLVAVVRKNNRARYEIRLRTCTDGRRRVVLALRELNGRGGFRDTGPTIVFDVTMIDDIRELLDAVSTAAFEEGLS